MPSSGDVVDLDLGAPQEREAGFRHPAVIVTAQRTLDASPSVIHVVPSTSTIRRFHSEIVNVPGAGNGLAVESAAQCQHLRSISPRRIGDVRGSVGATTLAQIREMIAVRSTSLNWRPPAGPPDAKLLGQIHSGNRKRSAPDGATP